MKQFFTLVLLLICLQLQAQIINRDSLVGSWVCTEVTFGEDPDFSGAQLDRMKEQTRTGLLNSKFTFGADGLFKIDYQNGGGPFAQQLPFKKREKWGYDANKKFVMIGNNLMGLFVNEEEGNVYFLLHETPVILKMVKQP
jgi:hypothetical protein